MTLLPADLAATLTCPRCAGQQLTCEGGAYCYKCSLFVATPGRELRPSYRGKETRGPVDAPEMPATRLCGGSGGTGGRYGKYGAIKTTVAGIQFDSKAEARRYEALTAMEAAGEISGLTLQPKFEFVINGVLVGRYTADFAYTESGEHVIEDCKSGPTRTTATRLRKRLMLACHGITVRESK